MRRWRETLLNHCSCFVLQMSFCLADMKLVVAHSLKVGKALPTTATVMVVTVVTSGKPGEISSCRGYPWRGSRVNVPVRLSLLQQETPT